VFNMPRMLRTILTVATCLLIVALGKSQQKIGSNVFTIDRASMLEIESDSSGILPPRLTTAQRDAQIGWDESHIIYNTTDNCLQIYNGSDWDCIVQGVVVDSSIYRHNGTLSEDRVVTMNGFQLTFDGSSDVVITSDGFLGIGDPTPEAKLDVEGGTVRFSDYGSGDNTGSESYLLGVDSEGDVIEVTLAIDTFMIEDDELQLSLRGDRVPYLGISLDEFRDTLNIYTDDGTLLSDRVINSGGNLLRYQGTDEAALIEFQNDGDIRQFGPQPVYQLVDTSGAEIRITTNSSSGFISTVGDQNLILRQNNAPTIGLLSTERIRLYNYGSNLRTGTLSNLIGVEADGDLIEIDPALVGSDDQIIDSFALVGNELQISLEDDVNGLQTLDLSGIGRNIYNVNDTLTSERTVTLDGSDLYFEGSTDSLVISSDGDVRTTGTLTLDSFLEDEDGETGVPGYVITSTDTGTDWISPDSVGTDDQIIDSLALVNDTLQISLESDVNGLQFLDLDTLRRGSIDLHDDVDVTTSTPTAGDILAWDGVNFVPEPTNNGFTIFEIFAEESGPLGNNESEWAFGNGDNTPIGHGIVIPLDCELWSMTLDHEGGDETTVRIVINNAEQVGYEVAISGEENSHSTFPVPLSITAGDILNFRTISVAPEGTSGRVSAWFRVRATPASNSLLEDLMDVSASTITNGQILVYDGATFVPGDDSDNQIIDSLGLTGTTLEIGIEDDINGLQTLDLSTLQDGIGTDNQIIDSLGLDGNELQIRIERDPNGLQTLDLTPILGSSENIYNTSDSLEEDRTVTLDGFSLTFDGSDDGLILHPEGDISLGTATAQGDFNIESSEDQDAFFFTQTNSTSGEKDVFTIEDQGAAGGSQDESSVLKVHKSGSIGTTTDGFSLVELAYTSATDPLDNKYWISGRSEDEGAPRWGVDITDNDFWSEGGIVLGVSGADGGTYSGGNFIVEPDGDVGIGTTTPRARLEVAGGSVIFDEYGIGTHNKTDTGAVKYILAVDTFGCGYIWCGSRIKHCSEYKVVLCSICIS